MNQSEAMFWATNAFVAKRFMKALPKKTVDLCAYNGGEHHDSADESIKPKVDGSGHGCGGIACLGGWVAVMPHFVKMGVTRDFDGAPELGDITSASKVAEILFGDSEMFSSVLAHEVGSGNDRKIAINRLNLLLGNIADAHPRIYEVAKEASRPKKKPGNGWPFETAR